MRLVVGLVDCETKTFRGATGMIAPDGVISGMVIKRQEGNTISVLCDARLAWPRFIMAAMENIEAGNPQSVMSCDDSYKVIE